jgi:hypothetical protein
VRYRRLFERQRTRLEQRPKWFTGNELARKVQRVGDFFEGVDRGNARVTQPGRRTGFAAQPFPGPTITDKSWTERFKRNPSRQTRVVGQIHDAHPAATNLAADDVGPDAPALDILASEGRAQGSGANEHFLGAFCERASRPPSGNRATARAVNSHTSCAGLDEERILSVGLAQLELGHAEAVLRDSLRAQREAFHKAPADRGELQVVFQLENQEWRQQRHAGGISELRFSGLRHAQRSIERQPDDAVR